MTVEDPIEYYIDGIGQTQVNTKVEMTFARGLRAILRQDPDVVMVGEIRDLETAQIAVQASLTGHLVLSTLHTNTAVGAVTRLRDMGIEPFLLVLEPDRRAGAAPGAGAEPGDRARPYQAGDYERRLLNLPARRPLADALPPGSRRRQRLPRPHRHLRAGADRRRDAHHDPRRRRRARPGALRAHADARRSATTAAPRCCAARRRSRKCCA